ncbi:hypothetical protein OHA79_07995 [Streptomyces sp. NBC_00841]|nr:MULTISPECIES: hypothetical protein [unclassified Streptomyces]MCX4536952.1 hypothetical protein [Streptomyces sp. NBC_01669]WRZ97796.1 hypothetical protein OHA79_07995 [Streptomyces sp. NBC_00841]
MDTDPDLAVADLAQGVGGCLATPGEEYPSLGKPVSSTTHTRGRTTATARRASPARTAPAGQVEDVMNCCDC